jgi:hypothetical protein
MLKVQYNFQQVVKNLINGDRIHLTFNSSDISLKYVDDASKLSLSTAVYNGGNYIPGSVRHSLSEKFLISRPTIRTYLTIDEQSFQINLNYLGETEYLDHHSIKELVEEFSLIAERWRSYLDERDKNDLVHVRAKL